MKQTRQGFNADAATTLALVNTNGRAAKEQLSALRDADLQVSVPFPLIASQPITAQQMQMAQWFLIDHAHNHKENDTCQQKIKFVKLQNNSTLH